MRTRAIGSLMAGIFLSSSLFAAPYVPPPGYQRTPESFAGDAFAVAPNGEVAVATNNDPNVRLYTSAAAAQAGTSPTVVHIAGAKYWGDLTFTDNNTLLISENSGINGVLSYDLTSGMTSKLGNVPGVQSVVAHGGAVYAVAANGPGTNAVYSLSGGVATPVLTNIGNGYAGGIAFDALGNMLVTDTNDPTFAGNSGQVLRFSSTLMPLSSIDLSGGNGSDAYDLALDTEGDIFVTTTSTLTEIPHGTTTAQQFGSDFGDFSFVTGLDFSGNGFTSASDTGRLWINAEFGDDGAIIGVQTPEPASLALLGISGVALVRRRQWRIGWES